VPGVPTAAEVRAWIGVSTAQVSDADLTQILDAEHDLQKRLLDVPEDSSAFPDPLARALYRRVQCHLARKGLPLGMVGGDSTEWSPVALASWDAEVQRIESSYVVPVVS
jgi:hypothetical protein